MTYTATLDGLTSSASSLNLTICMKRKQVRFSSSTSRVMKSPNSTYEEIYARLEQLIALLHDRHTINELCSKTGGNYRIVYRDIIRLLNLGYKVKNDTTHYWIDFKS